jgi:cytoskeletal protein CcmA (bactofilin family)
MSRRSEIPAYKVRTVLGGETKFNGILKYTDSLKIDGRFEGAIESTGFLMVESGAEVTADIKVGTLVVAGVIRGDVVAERRLELLPEGRIVGNIRCPNLIMAEGTGLQGRCEMLEDPSGTDIFEMPLDRLKKTIARVG